MIDRNEIKKFKMRLIRKKINHSKEDSTSSVLRSFNHNCEIIKQTLTLNVEEPHKRNDIPFQHRNTLLLSYNSKIKNNQNKTKNHFYELKFANNKKGKVSMDNNEETLFKNSILKRNIMFPKIISTSQLVSGIPSSRDNTIINNNKSKEKQHNNLHSQSIISKVRRKINENNKKILGNILEIRQIPFKQFHDRSINLKRISHTSMNQRKTHKPHAVTDINEDEPNDDIEYMQIKSVLHKNV